MAHFDPLGFAFLLMMVVAGFGFAWGRPVQTNPLYYDKYKQGIMLTAVAGPAINLCLAMFGIAVGYISVSPSDITGNSTGKPPASSTPRLTESASSRKCPLQGSAPTTCCRYR